jgi:hypothetical protein
VLDDELGTLVRQAKRRDGSPGSLSARSLAGLLDTLSARPGLWEPCVRHEPSCRWFGSLYRDDVVDMWLLTWQQDNSTDLHDHGGSSGAFRVVQGALSEDRPHHTSTGARLRRSHRSVGETVSFGPRLVHDVHNVDRTPAVSLHVYSPPLTSMTYYDLGDGQLHPRYTEPIEVRGCDGSLPGDGSLPERAVGVSP